MVAPSICTLISRVYTGTCSLVLHAGSIRIRIFDNETVYNDALPVPANDKLGTCMPDDVSDHLKSQVSMHGACSTAHEQHSHMGCRHLTHAILEVMSGTFDDMRLQ